MKLDANEQRLGAIWFFCAGVVGLGLIMFLVRVDIHLTYNDNEQVRAQTMHELRLAQTSLASSVHDERNSLERTGPKPAVQDHADDATEHHGAHH